MRSRFRRLRRFVAFFCIGAAGLLTLDDTGAPPFQPSPATLPAFSAAAEPETTSVPAATAATAPAALAPHMPPVPVAARALTSAVRSEAMWREKNRLLESLIGALTSPGEPLAAAVIELVPFGAGVALPAPPPLGKKLVEVRHKLYPAPPKLTAPRLGFSSLADAAGE